MKRTHQKGFQQVCSTYINGFQCIETILATVKFTTQGRRHHPGWKVNSMWMTRNDTDLPFVSWPIQSLSQIIWRSHFQEWALTIYTAYYNQAGKCRYEMESNNSWLKWENKTTTNQPNQPNFVSGIHHIQATVGRTLHRESSWAPHAREYAERLGQFNWTRIPSSPLRNAAATHAIALDLVSSCGVTKSSRQLCREGIPQISNHNILYTCLPIWIIFHGLY